MKPTDKEIEAAFREEAEAFQDFAKVRKQVEAYSLKEGAARKRLSLARQHKQEIVNECLI